jgi:hypothetical protein
MDVSVVNSLANSKTVSPFNSARPPQQMYDSPREKQIVQNISAVSNYQQLAEDIDSDYEMKSE